MRKRFKNTSSLRIEVDKKTFKALSEKKSISAAEYRELLTKKRKKDRFSFSFDVSPMKNNVTKITMTGKHLSKNRLDGASFKFRLAYKKAIKDAAKIALLKQKDLIKSIYYDEPVVMKYFVYNPISRDDDANFNTLKIVRDSIVSIFNMIKDDKRKYIAKSPEKEFLSKEYKIEVLIFPATKNKKDV